MPTEVRDSAPELTCRDASAAEARLLADINRQLIEDEWGGGGMSVEALEARMRRWISEDEYRAIVFEQRKTIVAYALVSIEEDSAYIRHFFVLRDHRGSGLGRQAIAVLFDKVIPRDVRVTLDVLASNRVGYDFWRSMRFVDYAIRMERLPDESPA